MTKKVIDKTEFYIYFIHDKNYDEEVTTEIPKEKLNWINQVFDDLEDVQDYLKELSRV